MTKPFLLIQFLSVFLLSTVVSGNDEILGLLEKGKSPRSLKECPGFNFSLLEKNKTFKSMGNPQDTSCDYPEKLRKGRRAKDHRNKCRMQGKYSKKNVNNRKCTPKALPPKNCDRYKYNNFFAEIGNKEGFHPAMFQANSQIESSFDTSKYNSQFGASGLMQFTPSTARVLRKKLTSLMGTRIKGGDGRCAKSGWSKSDFCHPLNQARASVLHFFDAMKSRIRQYDCNKNKAVRTNKNLLQILGHNPLLMIRLYYASLNSGPALVVRDRFKANNGKSNRAGLGAYLRESNGVPPVDMGQLCFFRARIDRCNPKARGKMNYMCPPETRCHVLKAAGLCGCDLGLIGEYLEDWKIKDGKYVPIIPPKCKRKMLK